MRLIELRARNLLRLEAVDIRPPKGVTPIKGKNGSGKTSTLDALWIVLKGKSVAPPEPIRRGAEQATIQASLGNGKVELVVTRKFTKVEGGEVTQSLDVRTGEGVKITKTPQAVLDALAGELGFDPLAFERAPAKDQFDMLRRLVPGIDFDAIAAERKEKFDERTTVNRQAQAEAARAAGIKLPDGPEPKPIDVSAKLAALGEAGRYNSQLARAYSDIEAKGTEANRLLDEAEKLRARAASMERQAADLNAAGRELLDVWNGKQPIDEAALREEIAVADRIKTAIALYETRRRHLTAAEGFEERARELTAMIEDLDGKKATAIAKAKLPVPGLGLGEGMVTFEDLPFSQASAAVKMRVSVAVAMALNPNLKVVLVRDGSLLDADSLKLLAEMAAEHGFDVLLETVDTSMPGGFEIVDGKAGQ